jgi:riboflavin synthase
VFTGIIERVGGVEAVREQAGGRRFSLDAPGFWDGLAAGASVAVDGVCLTIVEQRGGRAQFDVIPETLRCSTLGERRPGDRVNLERALRADARMDGHFVQGHVDAVATVARTETAGGEARWTFRLAREWMKYVIPKGAVAIDGISLTVASVGGDEFTVALIPTTLEKTTLGGKGPGARVNIETDILARTVVHAIESIAAGRGPPLDTLRKRGLD